MLKKDRFGVKETSNRFIKYPSIENSNRGKFLDTIYTIVPKDEKWCVLEKVHGANIQLYYDEKGFNYGKRSSFINGSFYNAHNILPKYEEALKKMYEMYNEPIRIFGEIFGGKYNGKYSKVKCVQKEVEYSQEIDAVFFDLMIGGEFVPYDEALIKLEYFDIPYVDTLKVCSLEEALEYKNDFDSVIPDWLYNLPIIEGNTCEGTVIKPYHNEYKTFLGSRIILKNKNEKFKEKRSIKKTKPDEPLSENANKLLVELESYITENRFNAVYSKEEYARKDFGMFLGNFVKDLREDAKKDEVAFDSIDPTETKKVNKLVNKKAVMFIKKLFFDKVEY